MSGPGVTPNRRPQQPVVMPPSPRKSPLGEDGSYLLPMLAFMGFTEIGVFWPASFPVVYAGKSIITAILLWMCWPAFTRIDWSRWRLGIIFGIVGIVQWLGMEKGLLHLWPNYPRVGATVFDPFAEIANPTLRVIFFVFRWLGPTLVVPVMEELFWRDYLWRTLIAPNDFKLARVGEWDTKAFWLVPVFFASVHVQWATAFVWAVMIGLLLLRTRSLGACIVMHAVTNFLLGAYVLWTHDWYFW